MKEQIELRQLEARCIQEEPPTCTAACPLQVDVRAMLAEAGEGNWAAALKILGKAVPFPEIIGRVCPQPCQGVCRRADVGDPISIGALERACAQFGGPLGRPRTLPRRGMSVAIVGAGLSGLTAGYDLARKGYAVVIHEASDRLGGHLWSIPESELPRQLIERELGIVEEVGAQIQFNAALGPEDLERLCGEFDAVYLAPGANSETFDLALDGTGAVQVHPVTFATSRDGVFAGGSVLRTEAHRSTVHSMSEGRRAAVSIDRYLQKVSLTASRAAEGARETNLYTDTRGIPPLATVPASDPLLGYTSQEAVREAQRCLQCECLECVKVCEYLKSYGSYPRKYVREIYNNLSIVKAERKANHFINSCSLCGLCGEVCPTDVDMSDVIKSARQQMVQQQRMPATAHDFALRDMEFSNSEAFALARNRPGSTSSEYAFFPGCQLPGSSPDYVSQVYSYLLDTLGNVGMMLRCCGAPADWAGRTDIFQTALDEFRAQHAAMGSPILVTACSSCQRVFREYLPDVHVISLWSVIDEHGPPSFAMSGSGSAPLSIHDPCSARYEGQVHDSVRNVLGRIGYQVEELPLNRDQSECCSYGGLMWLANRDLADAVVDRRVTQSERDFVTYCAMCRDSFAARGKRTVHLLDLLFGQDLDSQATRPSPGYSQRHENRARVKRTLLSGVWGEEMEDHDRVEAVPLVIAADVREVLDRRLILVEDVQRVIDYSERTGTKLLNSSTGRCLAHYRPNVVTYWVEYSLSDGKYVVHNAYSHRMHVAEDVER